jgi:hypothetical protein
MKYFQLLFLVMLFSACQKQTPTAATLRGSLDAASSITNTASRDDALGELAIHAAEAKDLEVTKQALGRITSVDAKDKAAEAAALAFAKKAETKAATEIARMINSTALQDRTLNAVAKSR